MVILLQLAIIAVGAYLSMTCFLVGWRVWHMDRNDYEALRHGHGPSHWYSPTLAFDRKTGLLVVGRGLSDDGCQRILR